MSLTNQTIATIDQQMNELTKQINDYHELYNAISSNASNLPKSNPHQATFNLYKNEYHVKHDSSTTNQYLAQIDTKISSLNSSIANLKI